MAPECDLHVVRAVPQCGSGEVSDSPAVLASKENVVHFTDVAAASGLIRHGYGGRLIVGRFRQRRPIRRRDFQPGRLCVAPLLSTTTATARSPDRAEQAGLSNQTGGLNIIQTDFQ